MPEGRPQRRITFVKAKLRKGEGWQDVQIGNVSSTGLLVRLADPPERGQQVEIRRRGWRVTGEVVWRSRSRIGVRSHEAIDVEELLSEFGVGPGVSPATFDDPAASFWQRLRRRVLSD